MKDIILFTKTMAERIKDRRIQLGFTQEELGNRIGTQRAAINKYESGLVENMKRNTIMKLSSALDVSPRWLMAFDTDDANSVPITILDFKETLYTLFRNHVDGYDSNYEIIYYMGGEPIQKGKMPLFHSATDYVLITDLTRNKTLEINSFKYADILEAKITEISNLVDNELKQIPKFIYSESSQTSRCDEENTPEYNTIYATEKSTKEFGYMYPGNVKIPCLTDRNDLSDYDFATIISDDSMEPSYAHGDVILIKFGYDNVNGGIYLVDYGGKTYIRKLYNDGDRFRLMSINKNFENIIVDIPSNDGTYFNIVGKVVDSFTPINK